MVGQTARLKVEIIGDSRSATTAARQTETAYQKVGTSIKTMARTAAVAFGGIALLGFAKDAVKAANDMGESWNKFDVVFGKTAKSVKRSFMGIVADTLGSTQVAVDAAATFGNMFKQMGAGAEDTAAMSKSMLTLTADLVSFHNADPTEVVLAIGSAFRGEYDSIQRWVPTITAAAVEAEALKVAMADGRTEISDSDRAIAVQTLLLRGQGDALGDAAETADSAANKQRKMERATKDASVAIGTALQPALEIIVPKIAALAKAFAGASESIQTATIALAGFLAVALAIGGTAGAIVAAIGLIGVAIYLLATNWERIWDAIANSPWYVKTALAFVQIITGVGTLLITIRFFQTQWANIWGGIQAAVSGAVGFITGIINTLVALVKRIPGDIRGALSGLADIVTAPFRIGIDAAKKLWNAFVRTWNAIEIHIPKVHIPMVGDIGGGTVGLPDLPKLARGGIVTSPTLALIGERGPEAVVPLGSSFGATTVINIAVQHSGLAVDSPKLQRDLANALRHYIQRNGPMEAW